MADELKNLIAKREVVNGQLGRLKNYYNSLNISALDDSSVYQLSIRLQKLEPLWGDFQEIQTQIESLCTGLGHDIQGELKLHEAFETVYFKTVGDYYLAINNHNAKMNVSFNEKQDTATYHTGQAVNSGIKLPDIKLPNFNGEYDRWLEFYDTFMSVVHNDKRLDDIRKFLYLKSCLTGEARECIKSIVVSASNYSVAWKLLQERFENKGMLINNHVKGLFDLPLVTKESHVHLRQLLDAVLKHIRCLEALGEPVKQWDRLLIEFVFAKLDSVTKREWTELTKNFESVKFEKLVEFLKDRCQLLEQLDLDTNHRKFRKLQVSAGGVTLCNVANSSVGTRFCTFCKDSHAIYNCEKFLKLKSSERIKQAKDLKLCLNCLKKNHFVKDCRSRKCFKCGGKHHTLLHLFENSNVVNSLSSSVENSTESKSDQSNVDSSSSQIALANHTKNNRTSIQILLSTACVQVRDKNGQFHDCRCLLDSGSQSCFITEAFCNTLGLEKQKANSVVSGINQGISNITFKTEVEVHSNSSAFSAKISCLILPKITDNLPLFSLDTKNIKIPENLRLADPSFNKSSKIDMLVGASLFWKLLCVGQIELGENNPTLQNTHFGWVISGPLSIKSNQIQANPTYEVTYFNTNVDSNFENETSLEQQVAKFWKLEECSNIPQHYTKDEQEVELNFVNNVKRELNGRFIVSIPLNENIHKLGESRSTALKRFYNLEKKLIANSDLCKEYISFMSEYERLGHMSKINEVHSGVSNRPIYYLPHHAVVKLSSLTTKVRVVFDGSCPSSTGLSLNNVQMVGPPIQGDLFTVLLNFRKHTYALTGDITKMYRQVLLRNQDRDLHRIFWRKNPDAELGCYTLNTVTYGTASAAFLAVRCLKQLAIESKQEYPLASKIIDNSFYVDDLLTGSESVTECRKIVRDITAVLDAGCFPLRKWLSNELEIFKNLDVGNDEYGVLRIGEECYETKALGILWNSQHDTFQYSSKGIDSKCRVTKRTILATTAQIFDPLGLLAPIIVTAKIIIQKLWTLKLSWDESIPLALNTKWLDFRDHLSALDRLQIPRHILLKNSISVQLHGFSDASELAYGACLYVRCSDEFGNCKISVVCSRSRVAPLKNVTLPRLELCAAVLLANLSKKVREGTEISFSKFYYWTDSTITLGWIQASSQKWKTFVANRVAEIQSCTKINNWFHIRSHLNPADILSRGVNPETLINSHIWWKGPPFLMKNENEWPINQVNEISTNLPEIRINKNTFFVRLDDFTLFSKFSSLSKLQRVFAYVLRFIACAKQKIKIVGKLSVVELNESVLSLIKIAQRQTFVQEISELTKNKFVNSKSSLLSLNPFVDDRGLIRVGGRLENSEFEYMKKYPVVLPSHHVLTKLIARNEHETLCHAGPLNLLASLRERYWPISGRNLVRKIVHDCIICYKAKPKCVKPFMGPLPRERTVPLHVFSNTGIDYAGPIFVKDRKTRGYKILKSYIALFICMSTRAIHLELVSSLTTDDFLAALRRFTSRRGRPSAIFSDNGTNFIGANVRLKELFEFIKNEKAQGIISDSLSQEGISWNFIPPRSPHFGGLWEAGIKSAKTHLRRVIGNSLLTFEEFCTVLIQIEGILNSRPISPLSSDPNDLEPLTPAHFLVGRKITSVPDPDVTSIPDNKLSTYQRQQNIVQHFWKRWNREYIVELQVRTKWKQKSTDHLNLGTLVIVREDNLPPMQWRVGRICELHPGSDGEVRVVSVQCAKSKVKRAVTKICVLPID